jgi:hypothetical protein
MSADQERERLRRLVNSSGFPLQLRVAEEIRQMERMAWSVIAEEHPWHDVRTGEGGFIDLVVGQYSNHDLHRMVIECKRTRDADWVFLVPDNSDGVRGTHARCAWISSYPETLHQPMSARLGHHDFYMTPESYISQFCVVRGSGEDHKPMLENLSNWLLKSVEAFAREELNLALAGTRTDRRYYVPIIVSNARLNVCRFSAGSVSLQAGEIPNADFEEVPYIRFTKSLTTQISEDRPINTTSAANRDRHRTVFVVQSSHFTDLMTAWHLNIRNSLPRW